MAGAAVVAGATAWASAYTTGSAKTAGAGVSIDEAVALKTEAAGLDAKNPPVALIGIAGISNKLGSDDGLAVKTAIEGLDNLPNVQERLSLATETAGGLNDKGMLGTGELKNFGLNLAN